MTKATAVWEEVPSIGYLDFRGWLATYQGHSLSIVERGLGKFTWQIIDIEDEEEDSSGFRPYKAGSETTLEEAQESALDYVNSLHSLKTSETRGQSA